MESAPRYVFATAVSLSASTKDRLIRFPIRVLEARDLHMPLVNLFRGNTITTRTAADPKASLCEEVVRPLGVGRG
jgi:hypothetical protein